MGFDLHICWAPEAKRSSASRAGVSVTGELQDAWPEGRLGPTPAWAIDLAEKADRGYLRITWNGMEYLSPMFGEQPTGTTVEEVEAGRGELIPARKLTHNDYQWISLKEVRGSLAMIAASQPTRWEVDPEVTALFRIWMGYLKLAAAELGMRVG